MLKTKIEKIQQIKGYNPPVTIEKIANKLKIKPEEILKLDSNENLFIPPEKYQKWIKEVIKEYDPRIYPQKIFELKRKIGDHVNISPKNILIGNGSDELIDFTYRLFLEKGDQIITIKPTFSIFKYRAKLLEAKYIEIPLEKNFTLNPEKILGAINSKTRLLIICSPNNPTANQFKKKDIQCLIKEFPGFIIIDEAYVEFADYSITEVLNNFEKIIVLRTFSKALGSAGLRLGYGIANKDITSLISEKIQLPYPINSFSLEMGIKILDNIKNIQKSIIEVKKERERYIKNLNGVKGVKAFESNANFVFFQTSKGSEDVYNKLLRNGIILKKLGKILHLNNCFRATIGLPEMNDKVLKVLKEK